MYKKMLLIILILLNRNVAAEELSWPCGDACTLTYNTDTNHVVVSGKGPMTTIEGNRNNKNEWGKYVSSFKSIEVENGITSIGDGAFSGANIESIIIPNTVTKIGNSAFLGASIASINIPDSVTSIGDWAFDQTRGLTEVVIPDSVVSMGYGTFFYSSIRKLVIPDSMEWAESTSYLQETSYRYTFQNVSLQKVFCAGGGDKAKCDELLKQAGSNYQSISRPNYKKDENGKIVEKYEYDADGNITIYKSDKDGNFFKYYVKKNDGSSYIYNSNGELTIIRGKKIYTVEEAMEVTKNGERFHVGLTYK